MRNHSPIVQGTLGSPFHAVVSITLVPNIAEVKKQVKQK